MKKSKTWVAGALTAILFAGNFLLFQYSFAAAHPAGTNVSSNGTIYMITDDGQRRPYTSAGAFLSYGFNSWAGVVAASSEDMALPQGNFIPPRDGKIVCSDRGADKGTCYLITNGKRAAFESEKVFKDLGFSFTSALYGDVSFLDADNNVSSSTEQHRPGVLVNKGGTIYLVSQNGLMGVPSLDILKSWGYSANDAVPSDSEDSTLSQAAVISNRVGAQLSPNQSGGPSQTPAPLSNVDESSIFQGYIDTYPDLPTGNISDPQDAALVLDLVKKMNDLPGITLNEFYPYLSSQSIQLLGQTPKLKTYFETPSVQLAGMSTLTTNVQIFTGGTTALYTESRKQGDTGYLDSTYTVCKKENGVWKWDFIGTLKYNYGLAQQANPGKLYTQGNGVNDIAITAANYSDSPMVKDPNNRFLVKIQNRGATTVKQFKFLLYLNNIVVDEEMESYEINPGQSIILAAPIDYYWSLNDVNKNPGNYATTADVEFDQYTVDFKPTDNTFTVNTQFSAQNTNPPVSNLVGGY